MFDNENGPFINDFPIISSMKTGIFQLAMFDETRGQAFFARSVAFFATKNAADP